MTLTRITTREVTLGGRLSRVALVVALCALLLGGWTAAVAGSLIDFLRTGDPQAEAQLAALDTWALMFFAVGIVFGAASVALAIMVRRREPAQTPTDR